MKKIIYILVLFFVSILNVKAEENLVNIYLFHSEDCIHCKSEIKLLNELEKEYSNIRVYKYEVNGRENSYLFGQVTNLLGAKVGGVPFTVIGGKYYSGFSTENGKKIFVATIEYYSKYGYRDVVGEYIGNIELPTYEIDANVIDVSSFVNDYGNYTFELPLIGKINTNDLELSTVIVLMVLKKLFGIPSLLLLLFLMIFIIDVKDKKKMIIMGLIYFIISLVINFIFMLLNSINIEFELLKFILVIIVILFGLYKFFVYRNDRKNNGVISVKNNYLLPVIEIIVLSFLISIFSLSYNLGNNMIFNDILYLHDLSKFFEIIYIFMYCLMDFVIDILLFILIMVILKLFGIFDKDNNSFKIVRFFLIVIFLLLIFIF